MTYSIDDILELIRYHLVVAAPDNEIADRMLLQLVRSVEQLITTQTWREPISWIACEECGAWVSSELIGPVGAGESEDGGFRCSECRFEGE